MDDIQLGVLKKFQYLKGELLIGKREIKGNNNIIKVPPDPFVKTPHILHDLVRGFYKPAGKPYILSYQATESEKNYGKQIIWDEDQKDFIKINMHPPRKKTDNRRKSDIQAARYNMDNGIPFGILHKVRDGQNRVMGLGKIVSEQSDGVFIVEPFELSYDFLKEISIIKRTLIKDYINTEFIGRVTLRRGQKEFRDSLIINNPECVICGLNDINFLQASHIKPWKDSTHRQRLDVFNGFLMCPNHDKVFDKGYITFTDEGNIIISPLLSNSVQSLFNLNNRLNIKILPGNRKYLKWHRENCFKLK